MPLADQLTIARAASVVLVVVLFEWNFENHLYWATAVFVAAMATDQIDGWLARRQGHTSALGSMLDPVADKVLVLAMLIMVVGAGAFPAWMVALIVAREFLVSGPAPGGDRARRRHPGEGPRQAEDMGAGRRGHDRRLRRGRRVERRRRVVGAARRARLHARVRARLRAGGAAPPQRARRRPRTALVLVRGVGQPGVPPRASRLERFRREAPRRLPRSRRAPPATARDGSRRPRGAA